MPRLRGQNGNGETHNSSTNARHFALDIGSGVGGLGRRGVGCGSAVGGAGLRGSGATHCRGGSARRGGAESCGADGIAGRENLSSIVGRARLLDARCDRGGDLIFARRALTDDIAGGAARALDGVRETSNRACWQAAQVLSADGSESSTEGDDGSSSELHFDI